MNPVRPETRLPTRPPAGRIRQIQLVLECRLFLIYDRAPKEENLIKNKSCVLSIKICDSYCPPQRWFTFAECSRRTFSTAEQSFRRRFVEWKFKIQLKNQLKAQLKIHEVLSGRKVVERRVRRTFAKRPGKSVQTKIARQVRKKGEQNESIRAARIRALRWAKASAVQRRIKVQSKDYIDFRFSEASARLCLSSIEPCNKRARGLQVRSESNCT